MEQWNGGRTGYFYDLEYPLPESLIQGKTGITMKVEANRGRMAGRIFGCRVITP